VANQEIKRRRVDHPVPKQAPRQEQSNCAYQERQNVTPLVAIQSGSNEQPHLIEHEWRGCKESSDETHLQIEIERFSRVQINQPAAEPVVTERTDNWLL